MSAVALNPAAVALPWLRSPLADAVARQRGHALLVHGPSGVGQFEFAYALAAVWLCEAGDASAAPRPCGSCTGCRLLQSRSHPDLRLVVSDAWRLQSGWGGGDDDAGEGGSGKAARTKPSRELRVDAVREAIAWTHTTASRGRGKLLLLHPAQAMNLVAANALLKTLEEPPSGVRLLLTCGDPELLLPTIRSRCQRVGLPLPDAAEALAWLHGQVQQGADVLLAAAGGAPLEAAALAADGVTAAGWTALPAAVARGDATALQGWPVPRAVQALRKLAHDAMCVAVGAGARYFPAAPPKAPRSLTALATWSRELQRVARHDEHPWNAGLLIESLVLQAARAWAPAEGAGARRVATLDRR